MKLNQNELKLNSKNDAMMGTPKYLVSDNPLRLEPFLEQEWACYMYHGQ